MRYTLILVLTIFTVLSSTAQLNDKGITYQNFEVNFFNYTPIMKPGVSEKLFEWAQFVISQTKKELNNDINEYNVVHYLNILSAFEALHEDIEIIEIAMRKFAESEGSCDYILNYKDKFTFDDRLPELYNFYFEECQNKISMDTTPEFNIEKYIEANMYNSELVHAINEISIDDQKYRNGNDEKAYRDLQPSLDLNNQIRIDSLYKQYNTYIGKSLVGKKFESVMWSVIQHSNPEIMEKYLDIIHKAVLDKELHVTPFKMLIDRLYGLKYGYQVFGSQGGGFDFKLADEKTRNEILKKYNIE